MIDEQLYSRQLYAIGHDAMKKMGDATILIVGMSNIGVEIAKNAILCGYKSISLYDEGNITLQDCGSNYYCTEDDIGKNRLDIIFPKLVELNPYVKLEKLNDMTFNNEENYSIIVLTQKELKKQIQIDDYCREHNCKLICVNSNGLWGSIFCDFGNHVIYDSDGEQLKSGIILNIEDNKIETAEAHNLVTGDFVKIGSKQYEVKYIKANIFSVNEKVEKHESYAQVKMPVTITFKSLRDSIINPDFVLTDYNDMDMCNILHKIHINKGKTFEELKEIINDEKYDETIKKALKCLGTELTPINSILGGIAAQEIMKASSGKYTPITQWLYFDAFSIQVLNNDTINSKYQDHVTIFGKSFLNKVQDSKSFIVGSGAIGCELLKNLAMMGSGNIVITDMDTIERSNLNRQFLFRNNNIGQAKSIVAASAIKKMNPDINIEAHLNRVGSETENVYDSKFYSNIDCIFNALDNVQARVYVDSRCVTYKKPLLESGTLSTKGNVQAIIPFLTESYASSSDPAEKEIPVCTIKNFPNAIEHTIQWAREQFEGYFNRMQNNVLSFTKTTTNVLRNTAITDLINLSNDVLYVSKNYPKTYNDCIRWGYDLWHELFRDQIMQLLHQFPEDHIIINDNKEETRFWSGIKKCPKVLTFDFNNEAHVNFVIAASKLWAFSNNIESSDNYDIVQTFDPKPYVINTNIKISANDEEEKKRLEELNKMEDDPEKILESLSKVPNLKVTPLEFEKDDDTNYHIEFITAASNMRAENYDITKATKHVTKGIAGKIIPALSTTTSVIAGLVCLEYYKVIHGFNKISDYKNTFVNLALPLICSSDPIKAKISASKYNLWDSFNYPKNILLGDLISSLEKDNYEIDTIGYNSFIVYSTILSKERLRQRMTMNVKDIIESTFGPINSSTIVLTLNVICDDEDIDMPNIILS